MDELQALISGCIRRHLESAGVRHGDFARDMSIRGFRWNRNTVTQVLSGRRGLSLLELAGVCDVLGRSLGSLLGNAHFDLPSGAVGGQDVISALTTGSSAWTLHRSGGLTEGEEAFYERLFPAEYNEAAMKAARRLGVTLPALLDAAEELWGRELGRERDQRVAAEPDESPRSLQARRGHVTRALLDELRAYFQRKAER